MNTRHRFPVTVLFCSAIGWGLCWLPSKALVERGLSSQLLVLLAFGAGALLLSPALWRQRRLWMARRGLLAAIGFIGGLSYASFQVAIAQGEIIRVMILFYLLPVWSALGGRYFLRERLDGQRVAAIAVCLGGAALALGVGVETLRRPIDWIDGLAIISGVTLAGVNLLFHRARAIPLLSKVGAMVWGCALQIALSLMLFNVPLSKPPFSALVLAVVYGIWITFLTLCTQWAVTRLEVGRSALILVMELVAAVISTALLAGQGLSPMEAAGAFLVLSAALLEGLRSAAPVARQLPAQ